MDKNSTSHGILERAIDFYSWTLTLSGKISSHWVFEFSSEIGIYDPHSYHKFPDDRTKGMLFVDSPSPTLLLTLTYLFIVWIGPKIMRK